MEDYDNEFERIPYDEVPISRNYGSFSQQTSAAKNSEQGKNDGGSFFGRWSSLLVTFLILLNIVLGVVVVNLYVELKKPTSVYNMDITIDSQVASDVLNAATKAKFSAVCVNAGNSSISTYSEFFTLTSRGSGVIIDIDKDNGDAYILTCYHVVMSSLKTPYNYVYILPYGSYTPIQAEVVNYIYTEDIALLKVTGSPYIKSSLAIACEVADSSLVVEGQTAIAIGNALNTGLNVTSGIISSPVNLIKVSSNPSIRVMKIDTAINGGNSGGGLFDINGKLIGIVNAKLQNSEVDNVAYAIPANFALGIADAIKYYGSSNKPAYGVLGLYLSIDTDGSSINSETGGIDRKILITNVYSPAYGAGIRENDVLVSLSYGEKTIKIKSLYDIADNAYYLHIGDVVTVVVNRGGTELSFTYAIESIKE